VEVGVMRGLERRLRSWAATLVLAAADARRLAPRGESLPGVLRYALRRRLRPSAVAPTAVFALDGVALEARPCDWCAVEEVLLDGEYDFVAGLFDGTAPASIVDLGANIGTFSARCLSLWPDASVVAVEAARDTYELLERNRRRNPARDWTALQGAVWSEDGFVSFAAAAQSTGSRIAIDGEGTARVPAVRLHTILARHARGTVDLLKMDIEGAEEAVLTDAEASLARVRTLVVEVHPQRCDHDRVVSLLREHYAHLAYVPGRRSSKPLLVASRAPVALPAYEVGPAAARPAVVRPAAERTRD
jgi:FkbM family methyltransferase